MSETTIANLPEEVLLEVFKWLDSKSLKNVEDTCDEWKEIARSIPRTLSLFGEDMEASIDSLLASRRKYDKALVHGKVRSQQKLLKVFTLHGANFRELEIIGTLTIARIWCQVFKTMPKLKKVSITGMKKTWEGLNVEDLPKENDLKKLESLKLLSSNTNCILLKIFEKCQLKALSVNVSFELQDREPLLNFLATQKSLEKLSITSDENLFATPIQHKFIPFHLKKLELLNLSSGETNHLADDNNLLNFMKLHAGTLETLKLCGKFSDVIYEYIFAKLKSLKTLRLRRRYLPQDSRFYERLEANRSVTCLECYTAAFQEGPALKGLIDHLPNIESLPLHNIRDRSLIKHIADTLTKLKKLDVKYFHGPTFNGLRFEALQSLEISYFRGPIRLEKFTKQNPGITELSIELENNQEQDSLDIQAITKDLKKLHTLTIKNELNCDEKFFDIIRQNCKELKSLNLCEGSLKVDISTVTDIPGLRFLRFRNFPF